MSVGDEWWNAAVGTNERDRRRRRWRSAMRERWKVEGCTRSSG